MNDIRDIKPPLELPDGQTWPVVLGGIVLLAVAWLVVWRLRKSAPSRRAKRQLVRSLHRLEADASRIDDRTFAYRLAELLRQALSRCTSIVAASLTTEEIIPQLSASGLSPDATNAVADALRRADGARYAPNPLGSADYSRRQTDLDTVRHLLRCQERSCPS